MTADAVLALLAESGCALLEQHAPAGQVAAVLALGDDLLHQADAYQGGLEVFGKPYTPTRNAISLKDFVALRGEKDGGLATLERLLLNHTLVPEICRRVLGGDARFRQFYLRRTGGDRRPPPRVPFHQDCQPFQGWKTALVTAWFPLTPCGERAPGLAFVPRRLEEVLPNAGKPAVFAIDEAEIERRFGRDAIWRPRFRPGDVMLFEDHTIHATHVTATMSERRVSLECRFTRAEEGDGGGPGSG